MIGIWRNFSAIVGLRCGLCPDFCGDLSEWQPSWLWMRLCRGKWERVSTRTRVEVVSVDATHVVANLREEQFQKRNWWHVLISSQQGNGTTSSMRVFNVRRDTATLFRRQRQRDVQTVRERRARRALQCVQMGELSAGRQALEGAEWLRGMRRH